MAAQRIVGVGPAFAGVVVAALRLDGYEVRMRGINDEQAIKTLCR